MQKNGPCVDLTGYDILRAYLSYATVTAKVYFDFFKMLRKWYSNYLSVGYHLKRKHFPIIGVLRDGSQRKYTRQEEIW
ncbi:MAG: hypothetical protein ACRD8W_28120, partial [Nitrososphaeraceae archaeon]